MDRHRDRGDRYVSSLDSYHYRHSRPSRFYDGPVNHHFHRSSPSNYRSGFSSAGGGDHPPFDSPPPYPSGGGSGFRPMGGGVGGGGGGFNSNDQMPPLSGQKRGYSSSGRGGSPGGFAKLFVGSVPRIATEEDIRPLFEEHGHVLEVALIKDKKTGQQQGCCFVKYATSEEANRAIRALHNQHTLPGGVGPIQVRYADGERERRGAVEYKLFVGSLSKQATEKEVEEIFSPYGQVEDVYLMRDEIKQSRGCGFVKFAHREMALAAINALNGNYTMRGCDKPLTVRFADPKRPPGESRSGAAFGGPGFGPQFQAPGIRPTQNLGEPTSGRVPPNAWNPMSQQSEGPSPNSGIHGFANQLLPRSGDIAMSSALVGPFGSLGGSVDNSVPGFAVSPSSTLQQSLNQPLAQVPSVGQLISPLQKSLHSPPHLSSSLQLQPQTLHQSPLNQAQGLHAPLQQLGQLQLPHSVGQTPFNQASQQSLGMSGQLNVSQPQVQHNTSSATTQAPLSNNLQPHVMPVMANQAQLPAQQQLLQPLHQSPSQFAQMLSQQTQNLQASFQSSQLAFSQLQHQLQLMQPSNQMAQQSSQVGKQQTPWAGIAPQTVASAAAIPPVADVPSATSDASTVPVMAQAVAPAKCNWTEHTSPDGYKYYYNSTTGESRWEKPEELTLFEQQRQQQPPPPQQKQKPLDWQQQAQSHPQVQSTQQVHQSQIQLRNHPQTQLQSQIRHPQLLQQTSQPSLELGYAQLQTAANSVNDPTRVQQGLRAAQEWMWNNKSAGTSN